MTKRLSIAILGLASAAVLVAAANAMGPTVPKWEKALHVPKNDYRSEWAYLGAYSVQADNPEDGAKELHVVYTDAKNIAAFKKDGIFPDGAVIIKDVFATSTEDLTTGRASYANSLEGRFVMVKDTGDKYADKSPLYGSGWGWAFYKGDETTRAETTDYEVDCLGCHLPAESTDYLYVQGYPVLK